MPPRRRVSWSESQKSKKLKTTYDRQSSSDSETEDSEERWNTVKNHLELDRHRFLGSTDLSIVGSLLFNYNVPTKIPNGIKLNKMKRQDDLIFIELGSLLTCDECDEIITKINEETFENMSEKYDVRKRNSSRLIIIDDRLGRTLWRRLKFSNKLTKLVEIENLIPLGFNVQGEWIMNGVNPAMRLNKYKNGDSFSPHKDAQYAPSGDERSIFSLLIYLNDNYEKGETKFYFPKKSLNSEVKGLTITEEINRYGGLEDGFECISVKAKKGFGVLFTHNIIHEATPPEMLNPLHDMERLVLRTDVMVKRKHKPLGFAICPEEKEDYLASLNFFREAQQMELNINPDTLSKDNTGELYERSLSIRYCYPRLLQSKLKHPIVEKTLVDQLPTELWLKIFKDLHEQDILNLIFAFPQFQLLKIVWEAQQTKDFIKDPSRQKYLPKIDNQYGSRTLFSFSDSQFFSRNIDGCCRVAAVYAFFLLGHGKDSTTYIVRYNKNTHEVCQVEMERVLADAFYNRNSYGSLYRVKQYDKKKRNPMVDFDHSVDRTYLTNRHQSQFIGQDLLPRFRFQIKYSHMTTGDIFDMEEYVDDISTIDDDQKLNQSFIRVYELQHAVCDHENKLVDHSIDTDDLQHTKNAMLTYCKHLLEQNSSTSLFRMISVKDHFIDLPRRCQSSRCKLGTVRNMIRYYNHLVFDFDTHHLTVERMPDKQDSDSLLNDCVRLLQRSDSSNNPILFYRVNIEQLAKESKGFNHASSVSSYPAVNIDHFSFLDYTQLSHVHLAITQDIDTDRVFALATYAGIVAL